MFFFPPQNWSTCVHYADDHRRPPVASFRGLEARRAELPAKHPVPQCQPRQLSTATIVFIPRPELCRILSPTTGGRSSKSFSVRHGGIFLSGDHLILTRARNIFFDWQGGCEIGKSGFRTASFFFRPHHANVICRCCGGVCWAETASDIRRAAGRYVDADELRLDGFDRLGARHPSASFDSATVANNDALTGRCRLESWEPANSTCRGLFEHRSVPLDDGRPNRVFR